MSRSKNSSVGGEMSDVTSWACRGSDKPANKFPLKSWNAPAVMLMNVSDVLVPRAVSSLMASTSSEDSASTTTLASAVGCGVDMRV